MNLKIIGENKRFPSKLESYFQGQKIKFSRYTRGTYYYNNKIHHQKVQHVFYFIQVLRIYPYKLKIIVRQFFKNSTQNQIIELKKKKSSFLFVFRTLSNL